jgi:hypothetical protein
VIPFLDISHHQGLPDFDALVAAAPEIPGVIIRAGNGLAKDRQVDRNMAEAKRVGLARSAYWFANPKAALGGRGQGALLAAAHHLYGCELPPMWDAENYSAEGGPNRVLAGAPAARWLAEMVHTTDNDSGRFSLGYTGASYWNPAMTPGAFDRAMNRFTDEWRADLEFLHSHDFILSRYPGQHRVPPLVGKVIDSLPRGVKPAAWEKVALGTGKEPPPLAGRPRDWDAWQWSAGGNEQGAVYGFQSTDLDLNIARVEAWARWTNTAPGPDPLPPTPSEDDMNYYVVTGSNARFIGTPAAVQWTGPGDDKITAAIDTQIEAGNLIEVPLTGGPNAFAATFLNGPLPMGDSLHEWTGDEFANAAEIKARPAAGTSVDATARAAIAAMKAGLADAAR